MVSTKAFFPLRSRTLLCALAAAAALSLAACDRMGGNKPPPVGSTPGTQNDVPLGADSRSGAGTESGSTTGTVKGADTGAPGAAAMGPGSGGLNSDSGRETGSSSSITGSMHGASAASAPGDAEPNSKTGNATR
jgi:hypothetical protein